ncbi:MAG: GIN domain-containing protein, partial [Candidatus Cryptobacteroides sp.]
FTGKSMNLVIYGASQVEGLSGKWSDLNIRLSGAADLSMVKVEAGNVTLKCEDAADFKISGKGKSVKIEASGSADIDAEDFEAVDVEAKLKGAADVTVNVKGTLKYSSTGSADFEWIGNPEIIRK